MKVFFLALCLAAPVAAMAQFNAGSIKSAASSAQSAASSKKVYQLVSFVRTEKGLPSKETLMNLHKQHNGYLDSLSKLKQVASFDRNLLNGIPGAAVLDQPAEAAQKLANASPFVKAGYFKAKISPYLEDPAKLLGK